MENWWRVLWNCLVLYMILGVGLLVLISILLDIVVVLRFILFLVMMVKKYVVFGVIVWLILKIVDKLINVFCMKLLFINYIILIYVLNWF